VDDVPTRNIRTLQKIQQALEALGVEFFLDGAVRRRQQS
jgi:hypothetical protein